ncbi:hypothetical protein D3C81_1342760 [compost metagenome]
MLSYANGGRGSFWASPTGKGLRDEIAAPGTRIAKRHGIQIIFDRIKRLRTVISNVSCTQIAPGTNKNHRLATNSCLYRLDRNRLRLICGIGQTHQQLCIVPCRTYVIVNIEAPNIPQVVTTISRNGSIVS